MHALLSFAIVGVSAAAPDCNASDALLLHWRKMLCFSLAQQDTAYCHDDWENITAATDWPNQAVYMQRILTTLAVPSTCLHTPYAKGTVAWLDVEMTNLSFTGNFAWTWLVFQVQYYDMPRQPGTRIEAPDTLGRKCWAMAYLAEQWATFKELLLQRIAQAGLSLGRFATMYERAMPLTSTLCQDVICNCFVNASFDPTRSGHCRGAVDRFHYLGFDREAIHPGREPVQYTWHEHC